MSAHDRRIDYIEFHAPDLAKIKAFYGTVFGWKFTDYGPDYTSFEDGRITGGFTATGEDGAADQPGANPLVVIYGDDLAALQRAVAAAGGKVLEQIEFPGGKRFYFLDPAGNRLAVWSDR